MALISRRWRGGRIIIIRVRASRCGESALTPADLTTHSPQKACSRPRTATRPSRAFSHPLPEPTYAPRSADAFPPTSRSIPHRRPSPVPAQRHAQPEPSCHVPATQTHARRPHNTFPTEDLLPPPHSDAPCPSIFSRPSRTLPLPHAAPTPARRLRDVFLAALTTHSPPKTFAPSRALPPAPAPTHTRRLRHAFPADLTTHSPPKNFARPRSATLPPLLFRFGHKKNGTAQWMCDAECLGRPSLRSVIGVGEPRAVRRRCGALAWRVGLRPQPWALRSRRCGRVLRA